MTKPKLGRPRLSTEKRRPVLVHLSEAQLARARKLGGGNISAGIRRALS